MPRKFDFDKPQPSLGEPFERVDLKGVLIDPNWLSKENGFEHTAYEFKCFNEANFGVALGHFYLNLFDQRTHSYDQAYYGLNQYLDECYSWIQDNADGTFDWREAGYSVSVGYTDGGVDMSSGFGVIITFEREEDAERFNAEFGRDSTFMMLQEFCGEKIPYLVEKPVMKKIVSGLNQSFKRIVMGDGDDHFLKAGSAVQRKVPSLPLKHPEND